MAHEVRLPNLGDEVSKATVQFWHLEEGDSIQEGDDLVEMATDKAVFNVPSPVNGVIKEIVADEGDTVEVGGLLAIIEEQT